jgi:hypothetical protein
MKGSPLPDSHRATPTGFVQLAGTLTLQKTAVMLKIKNNV